MRKFECNFHAKTQEYSRLIEIVVIKQRLDTTILINWGFWVTDHPYPESQSSRKREVSVNVDLGEG